jgi:hypothetical protein
MNSRTRLIVLAIAVAVNGIALGAVHVAMVDGTERAVLARAEPERVMVSGQRQASELARSHCPGTKAL